MCRYVDMNIHINLVKLQNIRMNRRRKQRAVTLITRAPSLSPTFEILLRIFSPSYIHYSSLKQSYSLSNIIMGLLFAYSSNFLSLQVKNMSPSMIWQQQISGWDSKTNLTLFFFPLVVIVFLQILLFLFMTFIFKTVHNDSDAVLGPGFLFMQYNIKAITQYTLW